MRYWRHNTGNTTDRYKNMHEPLTVRLTTGIYGQRAATNTTPIQLVLPDRMPTARDLIAAHVSTSFEQTLACRTVGAPLQAQLRRAGRAEVPPADLAAATARAWAALAERRALLVVDGAPVTDLDAPLHLDSRSEVCLMQVLPLLIGG